MLYRSQKYRNRNCVRGGALWALFLGVFVIANATIMQAASAPAVRKRCAFDIGSGETKISAAEVILAESDTRVAKLLAKKILVPFARNLKDGVIPDWLIKQTIKSMLALRSECEAVGAREFSGVATSGFRLARNGLQVLAQISQETKIPLQVITGAQEAVLGFLAAASALQTDGKNLVVWDIGGGSLQFSMRAEGVGAEQRKFVISAGHHGVELFRREIAKQLNRGVSRPVNPLSHDEITRAVELARRASKSVNSEVRERIRHGHMRVVGLGGIHTESLANHAGLENDPPYKLYTLAGVRAATKRAANMRDEDFRQAYPENQYPESQATNLALVLGYMEGLQIKKVIPLEVNVADGLLVDATYWPRDKLP
jgi:exopolyphosphatase/guanosine-5'-triphosphate,3'-diphosphate pyrophosphatase